MHMSLGDLVKSYQTSLHQKRIRSIIYEGKFITAGDFLDHWLEDFKPNDRPGCYVILIFNKPVTKGDFSCYKNAYIGQSVKVFARVHSHLTGHGNGDVYADLRSKKSIYVQIKHCSEESLNDMEKALIDSFDYRRLYNKTSGGGTERSFDSDAINYSIVTPEHSINDFSDNNEISDTSDNSVRYKVNETRLYRIVVIRKDTNMSSGSSITLFVDGRKISKIPRNGNAFFDTTRGIHIIELKAGLQSRTWNLNLGPNDQIIIDVKFMKTELTVLPAPHRKSKR